MKLLSAISSPSPHSHIIESANPSRNTWRRTHPHPDIEDLPFRKPSAEFPAHQHHRPGRDSRMKALPTTPLPLPASPLFKKGEDVVASETVMPETPKSWRSMSLPIMMSNSS
jgi:hypothetical protein